jgi:hypothetical protein
MMNTMDMSNGGGGGAVMIDSSFPSPHHSSVPVRQVTPVPLLTEIDFDHNADFPHESCGAAHPAAWEEFDPQPCDRLQQRVWDLRNDQFFKAPVLLPHHTVDRAYWLIKPIRQAIFGTVWHGVLLRRPDAQQYDATITHWETTNHVVAIKQCSKQSMGQAGGLTAENPRREVAAMQHVYFISTGAQENAEQAMERTGVMMPQDWLQDEHYCYSVMPFCNGGELFDRVGAQGRFTEDEARKWMHQILNVSPHMCTEVLNCDLTK